MRIVNTVPNTSRNLLVTHPVALKLGIIAVLVFSSLYRTGIIRAAFVL